MSRICHNQHCQRSDTTRKGIMTGFESDTKDWFCSHECFVEFLVDQTIEKKKNKSHHTIWKMQIGLLLLKRNLIDQTKLNHALLEKNRSGKMIGEILVDSGHITENDLKKALSIQAGVAPVTVDPLKPVGLSDTIPSRFFLYFNMTVFNVSHDEKIISVAVSDVQDLSYLKFFFEKVYPDYLIKFYLDQYEQIEANLNHAFAIQKPLNENKRIPGVSIKDEKVGTVMLSFLQFIDQLGGKNTTVDNLDQALWVRSELEGYQVDLYLTPKVK